MQSSIRGVILKRGAILEPAGFVSGTGQQQSEKDGRNLLKMKVFS